MAAVVLLGREFALTEPSQSPWSNLIILSAIGAVTYGAALSAIGSPLRPQFSLHDGRGREFCFWVIRFSPQGIMKYAANSSLESALRLRPNDLLHWRAIEWGCRERLAKYNLGGGPSFLTQIWGRAGADPPLPLGHVNVPPACSPRLVHGESRDASPAHSRACADGRSFFAHPARKAPVLMAVRQPPTVL
jgi:hypothetical protein